MTEVAVWFWLVTWPHYGQKPITLALPTLELCHKAARNFEPRNRSWWPEDEREAARLGDIIRQRKWDEEQRLDVLRAVQRRAASALTAALVRKVDGFAWDGISISGEMYTQELLVRCEEGPRP